MMRFRSLRNCPPTPPLSQHFALSEKKVLKLDRGGVGEQFPQKPKLTRYLQENHSIGNHSDQTEEEEKHIVQLDGHFLPGKLLNFFL